MYICTIRLKQLFGTTIGGNYFIYILFYLLDEIHQKWKANTNIYGRKFICSTNFRRKKITQYLLFIFVSFCFKQFFGTTIGGYYFIYILLYLFEVHQNGKQILI